MKILMMVFGVLDIVLVLSRLSRLPAYLRGAVDLQIIPTVCFVLLITFAISAFGFIRERRWVFPLSYAQFPFRIALSFMSLGIVAEIILPSSPSIVLNQAVWMFCAALEGVRLGLTIVLHREMEKSPNK